MMAEVLVQKNGAFMLLQMLNVRQNSLQKLKQKNVPHYLILFICQVAEDTGKKKDMCI